MVGDELDQRGYVLRRSSSAWAKYANAVRRISFARFSSRTSRSSSFNRSRSLVVRPGRCPASRGACRTHFRSVSAVQPSFGATDCSTAHAEAWASRCSSTIRTARSRTSGENRLGRPIDPILPSNEVSEKPGTIHFKFQQLLGHPPTLSRRGQHLNLTLRRVPRRIALHLFIDSTGLSMVGEGVWAATKHGRRGRCGWKKLHLGVDQAGVIVAQALTDSAVDDASTGIGLIETIASSSRTVTADAAYDTLAFYEKANTRGTTVVVPPAKTAKLSRRNPRSSARDGTIRRISKIGRRRWKKEVGYHRQARVENAFFRYKSMLGDRLRNRTRAAQAVESVLACHVLNRMTELGRPESFAIDR